MSKQVYLEFEIKSTKQICDRSVCS